MTLHRLTAAQTDRACGVLIASAAGDALGAGYEFAPVAPDLVPGMIGGGLGGFEPGEWTDDTAQAVAIARVAARGLDLRSADALDAIAQGFADWYAGGPADVGIQTSQVLSRAGRTPTGTAMAEAAREVHELSGRSAGNGSLMRTGPVALAYLDDPDGLVEAALAVGGLTHHQDVAGEACAVWCLMIRHAVVTGDLPTYDDVEPWVPGDRTYWRDVLADAEREDPSTFTQNGWAVGALQAAWSAITHTAVPDGRDGHRHLVDALGTAIRIGHDTDTVAAIAGALLGARWGMTAVPARWRRMLHGWPDLDVRDLEHLAVLTVRGGRPTAYDWPLVDRIDYADLQHGRPALAPHPYDDGVILAGATALDAVPDGVDVVVSLCLTGRAQVPDGLEHVTFRLMDRSDPAENPHLDAVIADAARTVAAYREDGRTVLLHCVAAHSRTPTVGIAYAMLKGVPLAEALPAVCDALPAADPNRGFRAALQRLEDDRGWTTGS
jgi:ADP-ribosyl-[dinitrogen reductase] hydrolase